jgi:hypothetical protein
MIKDIQTDRQIGRRATIWTDVNADRQIDKQRHMQSYSKTKKKKRYFDVR